jgi:hypothetical protein
MQRPARDPTHGQGNLALGMQESSSLPREAMSKAARYTLVVRARGERHHPRPWGWEICRDGEPLPARLREEGFKTEYTATAAGRAALRDFLAGLAEEETKPQSG